MSTRNEDDPTGGYVFGSAPPMPRSPAWDAPQAHQSNRMLTTTGATIQRIGA